MKALGRTLLLFLCLFAVNASANTITAQYIVSANGFSPCCNPPSAAPTDPVTGVFVVTFDPSVDSTGGLASISLILGGHSYATGEVGFSYHAATNGMLFGGTADTVNGIIGGTNDFFTSFNTLSLAFIDFDYSVAGVNQIWSASGSGHGSVQAEQLPNPVPEPAALGLFAAGALGAALRRKK